MMPLNRKNKNKTNLKGKKRTQKSVKKVKDLDVVRVVVPPNRRKKLEEDWLRIAQLITQELGLFIRGGKFRIELKEPKAVSGESSSSQVVPLTGKIDRPMQRATEFLDAYMKGFAIDDAIVLLRLDSFFVSTFTMEEVKQTLKNDHLPRAVARICGHNGKIKHAIQDATKTRIVIAGTTIHILGEYRHVQMARRAMCDLIMGAPPGKIYGKIRLASQHLHASI